MYCVYKHYCPQTRKVYIGLTKFGEHPNVRWRAGKGYQENSAFYNDIMTYGWDNFTHEILAKNLDEYEARKLESYYIKLYNATNPKYGYNKVHGSKTKSFPCLGYTDNQGRLRSTLKDCRSRYIQKYNKYYGG